jgi:hypothetical protein
MNSLSRWQRIQRFNQQLWKSVVSWLLEQLAATYQMAKPQLEFQPGILVLLREGNLPPMSWTLAIFSEKICRFRWNVRILRVKKSSGQFKRPIYK